MKITVLGCGSSGGVPLINGHWGQCDPTNRRNYRTRASLWVQHDNKSLIIDTGYDFREQALRQKIERVDGVIYTHEHEDHVVGIGELRVFYFLQRQPIPIYGSLKTISALQKRFYFLFQQHPQADGLYPKVVEPIVVEDEFNAAGLPMRVFRQDHGFIESYGVRIGNFAYSTDVVRLDEAAFAALEGVDVWIVDALRRDPRPAHSHLEQTLAWIERVKPKQAYLTHMDESMDYETLCRELPANVAPAYDGLEIEI
jgi:phosphoribosyl 1,2-cyclic phosphate phosphodiesterase